MSGSTLDCHRHLPRTLFHPRGNNYIPGRIIRRVDGTSCRARGAVRVPDANATWAQTCCNNFRWNETEDSANYVQQRRGQGKLDGAGSEPAQATREQDKPAGKEENLAK